MGISAIRIDSTRVEWYYKGKDRKNAEETKGDGTNNRSQTARIFKTQVGSHKQYVHPVKKGRVTIPFHCRDLTKGVENSILKQAKLK